MRISAQVTAAVAAIHEDGIAGLQLDIRPGWSAIRPLGSPSPEVAALHVAAMLASGQDRSVPDREDDAVRDIKQALAALAGVREALMADVARLEREAAGTRGPADAPVGPYAGEVMGVWEGHGGMYRLSHGFQAVLYTSGKWDLFPRRKEGGVWVLDDHVDCGNVGFDGDVEERVARARADFEKAWVKGGGTFAPDAVAPEPAPEPPKALPYAGQVAGPWTVNNERFSRRFTVKVFDDGEWRMYERGAPKYAERGFGANALTRPERLANARRAADAAWVRGGGTFAPGAEPEGVGS